MAGSTIANIWDLVSSDFTLSVFGLAALPKCARYMSAKSGQNILVPIGMMNVGGKQCLR